MVFQSNPGSGAFRSASIAFASPSQYDSSEYQPLNSQIRPHREELISKTSPKPKIRGGGLFPHSRGPQILVDSSLGFQSGFQYYVQDSSIMYKILVLCIGFQSYIQDSSLIYRILGWILGWILALALGLDDDDDHPGYPTPPQPIAPRKKTRREAKDPHLDITRRGRGLPEWLEMAIGA